jgi:phage terminase large subunit
LYIFFEKSAHGLKNREFAESLTEEQKTELTMADKAEPKSIDELRDDHGLNIVGAEKGPGSIDHGIKWLQDLEEIIIDPQECPLAAKEYINYALDVNRQGEVISKYPDKDNHSIDGSRYAMNRAIKRSRLEKKKKPVKIKIGPTAGGWK